MSYSAEIHFKHVPADGVYPFFQTLKKEIRNKLKEAAKDNYLWMPSIRYEHRYKDVDSELKIKIDANWASDSLFKFRYFYIPEHQLLGVFSLPTKIDGMFDNVTFFQNSYDQDYEFAEWNGIPIFEQIAKKWKSKTKEEVAAHYYEKGWGSLEEMDDVDYYRKSFAYDEIWEMFKQYLFYDEQCVYVSLFGGYESHILNAFVKQCEAFYDDLIKNEG